MTNDLQPMHTPEPFQMTPPFLDDRHGARTAFAFWFSARQDRLHLFTVLTELACVHDVLPTDDETRCLVEISDAFDPDEAWHWVRTELEEELNDIKLDGIWYDAIRWIL